MKLQVKLMCGALMLLAVQVEAAGDSTLKTEKEKVNYAIGVYLISNIRQQGVEIDLDLVQQGMRDAYSGKELLLDEGDLSRSIRDYQNAIRQKQGVKAGQGPASANKKVGDAFLAENRKKPGVVTLFSGLQYKVLTAGKGDRLKEGQTAEFQFRGTLLNGKEVASSFKGGKPAQFTKKDDAIPGVAEALRLMRPGAKWQLFVPPQLAYGDQGHGHEIGPKTTLIYEVELLTVK